jgi:transcriptional regulator with XRE-family HTH domain
MRDADPRYYRVPTGGELRAMRTALGLTQPEVSAHVDVGVKTIQKWENERVSPRVEALRDLIGFYRVRMMAEAGAAGRLPADD